jgi:large subunit ribosomal protein L24
MVVCPNCDKPTRIAHKILENGEKVRACKKCGEIIDKV